jgi:hypothetical protein
LWEKGKSKGHKQQSPSSPEPAKIIPISELPLALPAPEKFAKIDLSQSTVDPLHFLFVITRVAYKLHPSSYNEYLENLAFQLNISYEDKLNIFKMATNYNLQRCNGELHKRVRGSQKEASESHPFTIGYSDCNPDSNVNSEFDPATDSNPAPDPHPFANSHSRAKHNTNTHTHTK